MKKLLIFSAISVVFFISCKSARAEKSTLATFIYSEWVTGKNKLPDCQIVYISPSNIEIQKGEQKLKLEFAYRATSPGAPNTDFLAHFEHDEWGSVDEGMRYLTQNELEAPEKVTGVEFYSRDTFTGKKRISSIQCRLF